MKVENQRISNCILNLKAQKMKMRQLDMLKERLCQLWYHTTLFLTHCQQMSKFVLTVVPREIKVAFSKILELITLQTFVTLPKDHQSETDFA